MISQDKNNHYAREAFDKIVDSFKGDREKAQVFMGKESVELGGESGFSMVAKGRAQELNHRIDEFRGKKK